MQAVFKTKDERRLAQATLNRYNLTFSEFCRSALCEQKLPPHSFDFPVYKIAVQFFWLQTRILDNLRYLKNQARLGRIESADTSKLESAIDETRQVAQAVLNEIWTMETADKFPFKAASDTDND